jgi:hypothetical protein
MVSTAEHRIKSSRAAHLQTFFPRVQREITAKSSLVYECDAAEDSQLFKPDAHKRVRSASAAFRTLKKVLTNKHYDLKIKGSANIPLCLSILLYGSEIWCLRQDLFHRLRHFHH